MGGVSIAFIADILGRYEAILLILLLILLFFALELLKPWICTKAGFGDLWKGCERREFALDPFLYLVSILALLFLSFYIDENICYASIVVLTIGDGMSTIVGVRGRRYFRDSGKTIEGAVAGIVSSSFVGFFFVGELAIIGSLAGMMVEVTSRRFDNISVPFSALFAMLATRMIAG